jgi:8-oxo-dGTP pyrophosphatase MutT (NUDIX family)
MSKLSFSLPRNRVVPVSGLDVRLDPAPHPFEIGHQLAIEENWRREREANPALFDGRLVLLSEVGYDDGRVVGRCHSVRYATLLYWRRARPQGAEHAYAHAALVSSDNALVAIRMGAHTANAGKVYFAAGSFEAVDFIDGVVDVEANMAREVREETGLDISGLPRDDEYQLFSRDGITVVFKRYYIDQPAEQIAAKITDFVERETDPEIAGPVIIRGRDNLPDGVMPYMNAIIDWHFSG